jgi:hypothetical protein
MSYRHCVTFSDFWDAYSPVFGTFTATHFLSAKRPASPRTLSALILRLTNSAVKESVKEIRLSTLEILIY